jgi:serine/threonine protein kinase
MSDRAQAMIGQTLAGYRVDAFVGQGGMGEVYRALDTRLGRNVALKVLAPRLADDERFRVRFLHESRLAASLDHPSVIPIYEAGEAEGRLFIAMRFVDGTDLRRVLDEERILESERALALLGAVAGALDTAHAKGLVHRDVKPANILVAAEPAADPPEHVYKRIRLAGRWRGRRCRRGAGHPRSRRFRRRSQAPQPRIARRLNRDLQP